ncbi:MAG: hypothetical protein QM757_12205 [Paludibaculum sp.]
MANITAGDKIRLDIESVGHGIETVTVTRVGTQSSRTALTADANAGATSIKVRSSNGFTVGDKLTVGTPANQETVTISAVGASVEFTPSLAKPHLNREEAVATGFGPRSRRSAPLLPCGQHALQRQGDWHHFPTRDRFRSLQQ